MIEKRFMLDDAGEIIDLQTHQFIEYGNEMCELLNSLDEEIKQLQDKLDVHIALTDNERTKIKNYIKKIEKENQQQKETIKILQSEIERWEGYMNDG